MKEIKISFFALSRRTELELKSKHDIDPIISDLFEVFAGEVDTESFQIKINALQKNTAEFRERIDKVVEKYKTLSVKIQQLKNYFRELEDDEFFLVFPNATISKDQSFDFFNFLSSLKNNENYEELSKKIEDLFGVLRSSYEIYSFDENTRNRIGEADKSKRVCRFCNKPNGDVSFKKVAHAVSEALGNKKIITNDECDACNENFGSGIENDLILYLDLYRNFFGVKGKNGVPKLKGKNFEIENNKTITIKHYLTDDEIKDPDRDNFELRLETDKELRAQHIYKALVKYALGVLDRNYLADFQETIQWINGSLDIDKLPKIAKLFSYQHFTEHPKIMVYVRKDDNFNLPYAVAEFRFTFLTFVYIIPVSDKDNFDFTEETNYEYFWDFFKHYGLVKDWEQLIMHDNIARKFTINLNFEIK